jgi:hypothetical protein
MARVTNVRATMASKTSGDGVMLTPTPKETVD